MSKHVKVIITLLLGILVGVMGTLWYQAMDNRAQEMQKEKVLDEVDTPNIVWRQNHFVLNDSNLYHELIAQGIDYPEIVLAQAQLETGHYTSYSCLKRNNLFGMYNSRKGTYMQFPHWTICVAAYKKYIQKYDLPPNDYYEYLDKLGYAEDKEYTNKLRAIVNKK